MRVNKLMLKLDKDELDEIKGIFSNIGQFEPKTNTPIVRNLSNLRWNYISKDGEYYFYVFSKM